MLQHPCIAGLALLMSATMAPRALAEPCAQYVVRVDNSNPLVAEAVLLLPPGDGQSRVLVLRGAQWGLAAQISNVRGDKPLAAAPEEGRWTVPPDCTTVRWKIHFQDGDAAAVQASAQQNVFFRKRHWWLVSEPTGLLRLEGAAGAAAISFEPPGVAALGAIALENNQWRLPAAGDAPEFFVVGRARSDEIEVAGFRACYVADDAQRVSRLGLQDRHAAALRYLLKLFPQYVTLPEAERRLLIVWIGVDAATRHVGGAAGSRSFIANYVFGDAGRLEDDAASSLMVVAHEQFHQLTALCIHRETSLPIWVNESLAQYYGLKALASSGLGATAVTRARERFIDPDRFVAKGLAELSRRYHQGDRSVYPLFYSQGATLWAELDQALVAETGGERSLDDFLPLIFAAGFDATGNLPEPVLAPLREALGQRLDDVVNRYVGR